MLSQTKMEMRMMRRTMMAGSIMALLASVAVLAQKAGTDTAHSTVSSAFPQVWDCLPQHYDCVLAVRITPIDRERYMKVMSFVCLQWSSDYIPKPMDGFSAGFSDDPAGGTGYIRMEFQSVSKSDIGRYMEKFKGLLKEKLKQQKLQVVLEMVMVLGPQLQEKLKMPNQEYERYGPVKVE